MQYIQKGGLKAERSRGCMLLDTEEAVVRIDGFQFRRAIPPRLEAQGSAHSKAPSNERYSFSGLRQKLKSVLHAVVGSKMGNCQAWKKGE